MAYGLSIYSQIYMEADGSQNNEFDILKCGKYCMSEWVTLNLWTVVYDPKAAFYEM